MIPVTQELMEQDIAANENARDERGMSLIEILIVISLMAVVGTIAATKVLDSLQEGNRGAAKTQIAPGEQQIGVTLSVTFELN